MSFAVHWVKAEIHEFVLRNWRIVKIATTKAQRKLFFNLRSSKKRLGLNLTEAKTIAENLGVQLSEVLEMDKRMQSPDMSFDPLPGEDTSDDARHFAPSQYLEDHSANPATIVEKENLSKVQGAQLAKAIMQLDDRSKDILQQRWMDDKKATLQNLADKYGVSAERIRQLEANLLKKLRNAMESATN